MDGSNWGNNPKVTVVYCCCLAAKTYLTLLQPLDCSPSGSSVQGSSQAKNTGVGCHFLLQGIFLGSVIEPTPPA